MDSMALAEICPLDRGRVRAVTSAFSFFKGSELGVSLECAPLSSGRS